MQAVQRDDSDRLEAYNKNYQGAQIFEIFNKKYSQDLGRFLS